MNALALQPTAEAPVEHPTRQEYILELVHVAKRFTRRLDLAGRIARALGADIHETTVHAVDGVSMRIRRGEVVGLVGESGCGKSTLGRIVAGIHEASDGDVLFDGDNIASLRGNTRRHYTRAVQMVFQDPFASLNPRMRVAELLGEGPRFHGLVQGSGEAHLDALMRKVGLDPAFKRRFPHQFSGGQRQRICIARALGVEPELLVCDEPVAALDVSIQAQIVNLFMDLRDQLGLTYLFISHDLGVIEHLSDRVVIMYLGRVVEEAPTEELFQEPNHPYARALLAGVPRLDRRKTSFAALQGEIPSPLSPPAGCHFHPRCPLAMARCREEAPRLKAIAPGRLSACHLNDAV